MSKIIIKRNTQINDLKNKIQSLQDECGKLYKRCRNTGVFDSAKHDQLLKEIEWNEYLLWGARNGNLN
jgi:23S rRNA maturation mini-RNase III